jgi:hypothetical protein
MSFVNAFIGVPQSRYAAFAVITAMIVVSLTILFGNEAVPLSQKFAFVFMLFLVSLPGLLLSLFQLTCIVVGAGRNNQRPWCSIYAWIISILLIIYCALLIILAVFSLSSRSKTMGEVAIADAENFVGKFTGASKFTNDKFTEHFTGAAGAAATPSQSNVNPPPMDTTGPTGTVNAGQSNQNTSAATGVVAQAATQAPQAAQAAAGSAPTQHFHAQKFHNQKFHNQKFHNQKFTNPPAKPEQTTAATAPQSGGFHNQKFKNNHTGYHAINGQSDVYGGADDKTNNAGVMPMAPAPSNGAAVENFASVPPSNFKPK